jgi:hypothetical protein
MEATPSNTTHHSLPNYPIHNTINTHIPVIQVSQQYNVPNSPEFRIPKNNVVHFNVNPVTSMTENASNTVTIAQVYADIQAQISAWNSVNSSLPSLSPSSQVISPPFITSTLQQSSVMTWSAYCNYFYFNRNDTHCISSAYASSPIFSTALFTYINNNNELCNLNLFNIFSELFCKNHGINLNTLDWTTKIELRSKLTPYTSLYNFNGDFKTLSIQDLYAAFNEAGLQKWNPSHLNNADKRPNIYQGAVVRIEHQYVIIVKIADEPYKVSFTVPYYVLLPDWVSQTQISKTEFVFPNLSDSCNGSYENSNANTANDANPCSN